VSWGPDSELSAVVDVLILTARWDEAGLDEREVSLAAEGGPLASSPARAGLKRPASLLLTVSFVWKRGGALDSFDNEVRFGSSRTVGPI